jgi:hypothetical protein
MKLEQNKHKGKTKQNIPKSIFLLKIKSDNKTIAGAVGFPQFHQNLVQW